jgi:hypothetical protein
MIHFRRPTVDHDRFLSSISVSVFQVVWLTPLNQVPPLMISEMLLIPQFCLISASTSSELSWGRPTKGFPACCHLQQFAADSRVRHCLLRCVFCYRRLGMIQVQSLLYADARE